MSKPRVGFLGVGWIGRHRMQAIIETGAIDAAAIADPAPECQEDAAKIVPEAARMESLEELLRLDLDGVVIATPSALHAEQAIAALERGAAVFCQKPLGRTQAEACAVVDAARKADRLLGVDMSYRKTAAAEAALNELRSGALGHVFAVELKFHNAYGPDKPWFRNPVLSGGGCLIDLGTHLVDLALLALDYPEIRSVSARLLADGQPLPQDGSAVEDYAAAELQLANGTAVRIACSWNLHAGCDAVIGVDFHGTQGGVSIRNLDGSFYDFEARALTGTANRILCSPPDEWGGREAAHWARQLAHSRRFRPEVEHVLATSAAIDRIYASGRSARG